MIIKSQLDNLYDTKTVLDRRCTHWVRCFDCAAEEVQDIKNEVFYKGLKPAHQMIIREALSVWLLNHPSNPREGR